MAVIIGFDLTFLLDLTKELLAKKTTRKREATEKGFYGPLDKYFICLSFSCMFPMKVDISTQNNS